MEKINWIDYIIANNPHGANQVLVKYGFPAADYDEDLAEGIELVQLQHGNQATIDLMKQHPDYDVIVDIFKTGQTQKTQYKNALGENDNNNIVETQGLASPQLLQTGQPIINVNTEPHFSITLTNVILVIGAIWLLNKIFSQ